MWGGGEAGGWCYVVVFNAILFEFRAKQQITEFERIFSSPTFLTRIFSYSILKVNLCTSRREQLQQKMRDECLLVF